MVGGETAGGWPKTRRDRRPDLFWNNSEQTSFNSTDFPLWDRHLRQKTRAYHLFLLRFFEFPFRGSIRGYLIWVCFLNFSFFEEQFGDGRVEDGRMED
jgi:hypothetical protein